MQREALPSEELESFHQCWVAASMSISLVDIGVTPVARRVRSCLQVLLELFDVVGDLRGMNVWQAAGWRFEVVCVRPIRKRYC